MTFWVLPGLMVPTLNLAGSARAASNASLSVCIGESALTSSSRSNSAMVEIEVNAVAGSNGMVLSSGFAQRDPAREHEQCVAVRLRRGHGVGGDDAAGAGTVLDHDLLAGALGELLADQADGDVGEPAGAERHDDADRAAGVGRLRARGADGSACRAAARPACLSSCARHISLKACPLNFPPHSSRMAAGNCSHPTPRRGRCNAKTAPGNTQGDRDDHPALRERPTHVPRGGAQRHGLSGGADRRGDGGPERRRADQGNPRQDRWRC